MANWFGNLDLSWKYGIVFGALIVLTMTAGGIKVLYNHRRLKKHTKLEALEAGKKEDQLELAQREKDEGDLFGIRAIEAGFFGGVHQSRPTSRAGSFSETGSRGTSTLLGGVSHALSKDQYSTMNSSVATLPLAHTAAERDSAASEAHRRSPPAIRLAPSEAELNGRINHSAAVNMNLAVPPSPVLSRHPSPAFGGSDDGESSGRNTPASLSPRSPTFPNHYVPKAPQLPMPAGLSVTVHAPADPPHSEAASFNESPLPSRGPSPSVALPALPTTALSDEPPTQALPPRPSSPPQQLLPQAYQPTHQREMSEGSSVYDPYRTSTYEPVKRQSMHQSTSSSDSFNFSYPENSNRNSQSGVSNAGSDNSANTQNNRQSMFLSAGDKKTNDPRLSEFYDAYYRQSQLMSSGIDATKRPEKLNLAQDTIVEVDSPLPSPNPSKPLLPPGAAY